MVRFERLDAPLGARVFDYAISGDVSDEDIERIKRGLKEYSVLLFRGHQQPTDNQLVEFARHFGTLAEGSKYMERYRENPEILHVGLFSDNDGKIAGAGGNYPIDWHSDYSFSQTPGIITFLDAVVLPKDPPHTYFLSQYDALDRLDMNTKEYIRKVNLFHSTANYGKNSGGKDHERLKIDEERDRARGVVERPRAPEAIHPIILRHPETGLETLYISPALVEGVDGITEEEGIVLREKLYNHVNNPKYIYAHDWQAGDLIVFDTLGTLHARDAWDASENRHMRQMTVIAPTR